MKLISYNDLERMRLKDFLLKGAELYVEKSGMEINIGLGGFEQFGETIFGWKQGNPFRTAEVTIDLEDSSIQIDVVQRIISKLGLPIKKGMKVSELVDVFGPPASDKPGRPGTRLLQFICGEEDKYILGCHADNRRGLLHFFLARKDYCEDSQ